MSNGNEDAYPPREVLYFVKYLGLHRHADPPGEVHRRDLNDYRQLLHQLIRVNKTRQDKIGKLETAEAVKQLAAMK